MVEPSPPIEVRRSTRRRRTVSAYREGDKIVILMPARTSKAEERQLITEMVDRVRAAGFTVDRQQRIFRLGGILIPTVRPVRAIVSVKYKNMSRITTPNVNSITRGSFQSPPSC